MTADVSPPSGTLPQPVISIKRSGEGTLTNRILVMYISENNTLDNRISTDGGAKWSSDPDYKPTDRFRPSLTPPWSLNVTGVNVVDVVTDTGVELYRNRYATESNGEGWSDEWQGEEQVPGSSASSLSATNSQIVGGQGNNHLDFVWELDQQAVCYQRRSFYTGQWSAMQEFNGSNYQKPTISYLNSDNVVVVWTDGTDVLQAKYTESSNSWSGVSNLGAGVDPHISTSGGDIEPDKAKYIYRDASSFPYALNTQSGAAFQKVIAGGNVLPETYARRISATDTLTGAGFLVELETPKVKTTSGNLYELPFVVTNDTLLNLSLNNLAPYLNTQSGTLPLDSDSLIFEVKIHSKDAALLGTAGNLIPTVTVRPDATPGLALPVQLANLKVTPKLIQRKSVGLRTLKGQMMHLEMEMQGLNKNRSSLIPVLTHVHYINQGTQLTKGVLDDRGTLIEVPSQFSLAQNYPNPFNPSTVIRYALPQPRFVTLRVYNVQGQEIVTLVEKEQLAGRYQVQWDGLDRRGAPVAAGLYFYRLEAGEFRAVRRMVLLK
ncbi:MAG: T9SS type A sorting domain-containing protein [Phycisphaerae bacterium]|nr:T9SS type A sorting domain-containing protein [candidate division KSB1 bacterium]NIV00591.1 T9SS type A sorting domain-containing protein [Phycisphaerae bacterium]NIT70589.1 T9SS type A sorting domain-containing protein [candidate division KSB1 bacterium]NIU24317.1 T9SS type A sorting domain-containing protein [candidate division KSB1 bacterium]NIV70005.1 T9SS type A sorting domain-containing protein [Phycisphaerae bacterium]